ncbi:hypothetical protein M514_04661 [Trichuris suis]|uniref:Ribosomal protein L7Ae/L30e/S12e/Gadd45 domain-containing protein n=1 Tax=Trichuris suis TaxID=68888 RepID=A0A085MBB8_9BILA|nr:hypothetical protein M513_04661 [Trichuris suis]KFD73376.1 hypothetical protein M514_04661 [Trichuris suis]KHJ45421.1 hypothetical protein D918_04158 [Trichuris suis]
MGKIKSTKKKNTKRPWNYSWAVADANISDPILQFLAGLLKSTIERRATDTSTSEKPLKSSICESGFAVGLRSVLRHLEQGKLVVALFNHEDWPGYLCYHVGIVSKNSCTHCAQVKNLSAVIAPVLGCHSVRAFGIKNSSSDEVQLLVDQIKFQLPQISVTESDFLTYFQ